MSNSFELQYKVEFDKRAFEDGISKSVATKAKRTLNKVGETILAALRIKFAGPGSGALYRSKLKDGTMHQASAPGEPPASDRGVYADSFYHKVIQGTYTHSVGIASTLWELFGRRLEFGGHGGGVYIAPRPHIRPVFDEHEGEIQAILEDL
jgi:hypothetical protein